VRRATLTRTYQSPTGSPLQLRRGDHVHVGSADHPRPGFEFVLTADGHGWVPTRHLTTDRPTAVIRFAYDTTELDATTGTASPSSSTIRTSANPGAAHQTDAKAGSPATSSTEPATHGVMSSSCRGIVESMADVLPPCPSCAGEHTYEMSTLYVCPLCGFEWSASAPSNDETVLAGPVVKGAVGNVLADGDTVVVTASIKVKGLPPRHQSRNEGPQHPPHRSGEWTRHRLQSRRIRCHAAEIEPREKSLTRLSSPWC